MKCARSWKFCYVDGIRFPSTPEMLFGTAFHNAGEAFIASGHDADLTWLFKSEWAKEVGKAGQIAWGRRTYEGMMALGVRMCGSRDIVRRLAQIGVAVTDTGVPMIKHFFKFEIPGVGVPFVGEVNPKRWRVFGRTRVGFRQSGGKLAGIGSLELCGREIAEVHPKRWRGFGW